MKLNEALDCIGELFAKAGANMDDEDERSLDEWWAELVPMIDEEIDEVD